MSFAFAMRIAPVQIWWAMKYHSLEFEEIDGYLTSGSVSGGTRRIGAREWRIGPIAAEDWLAPELSAQAARERARFAEHRILYACLGREEKLNSAPFLRSVAAILKAVPEAGFLWTGRQQHAVIQATLEAQGVAQRCHFIGWVNTRLYAQVIDVFLDSFPFPCAYTLYEVMAAGKPAVLYASEESAETAIARYRGNRRRSELGSRNICAWR
jgi:predicted O-linked N-acetylglucosamine transferase (SPINDLY family)